MISINMPLFSPIAIAPMIDWTYIHFRVLMRILAPRALLYTEMQTTGAVEYNAVRALEHLALEYPLALQLGGSDKIALAQCAKQAEACGFSEINLNLGCPSDRVQAGQFGACLMADPKQVAECIEEMKKAVKIPVTAKTRIGIDDQDNYDHFANFAHTLINAGCDKLIVHARKAWLKGLSPKQNRTIPPLHYDFVYRIKTELPNIPIVINGNIQTIDEINNHLRFVDGVMLGRLACQNPYQIALIHHAIYPEIPLISRQEALQRYLDYVMSVDSSRQSIGHFIKPILNLTHGLAGSKAWREQVAMIQRTGDKNRLMTITETPVIFNSV